MRTPDPHPGYSTTILADDYRRWYPGFTHTDGTVPAMSEIGVRLAVLGPQLHDACRCRWRRNPLVFPGEPRGGGWRLTDRTAPRA
ncbi:MAG: hypothetical protein ACXWZ2_15960 [Mycobacterium sp.]